ncbi:unnamed protein product [Prunus armeniaca]|uniref:Uncharacterized protein n=1 Tax=Prunus armeniaca TaxID=36596 RepID=A0A6J5UF94_PRUAR|nr:unnamed protein product [Prunus armeniaca]
MQIPKVGKEKCSAAMVHGPEDDIRSEQAQYYLCPKTLQLPPPPTSLPTQNSKQNFKENIKYQFTSEFELFKNGPLICGEQVRRPTT